MLPQFWYNGSCDTVYVCRICFKHTSAICVSWPMCAPILHIGTSLCSAWACVGHLNGGMTHVVQVPDLGPAARSIPFRDIRSLSGRLIRREPGDGFCIRPVRPHPCKLHVWTHLHTLHVWTRLYTCCYLTGRTPRKFWLEPSYARVLLPNAAQTYDLLPNVCHASSMYAQDHVLEGIYAQWVWHSCTCISGLTQHFYSHMHLHAAHAAARPEHQDTTSVPSSEIAGQVHVYSCLFVTVCVMFRIVHFDYPKALQTWLCSLTIWITMHVTIGAL
jgi:hypothetical protein